MNLLRLGIIYVYRLGKWGKVIIKRSWLLSFHIEWEWPRAIPTYLQERQVFSLLLFGERIGIKAEHCPPVAAKSLRQSIEVWVGRYELRWLKFWDNWDDNNEKD